VASVVFIERLLTWVLEGLRESLGALMKIVIRWGCMISFLGINDFASGQGDLG
jgi:hypothetical protein